jgi:RNA polymerase sigma-70 factor (ECF subfamily)
MYSEHGSAVLQVASRFCRPDTAEEVCQDVFLHLWSQPQQFDPSRGTLRMFLLTLARSRAIDAGRSESRRSDREERHDNHLTEVGSSIEDTIIERETATRVTEALASLPETERKAITVAFYGHHSYHETAVILGQPEGTTKARIRSGLKRLRPALSLTNAPPDVPLAGPSPEVGPASAATAQGPVGRPTKLASG